jgi:NADH dehydrogenase [ubiquinone] 1 alpha subcomplex assembly factor 7
MVIQSAGPEPQGDWLRRLGIVQRTATLLDQNPDCTNAIHSALDRLTGATGMGELFKVMAIHSPGWPAPAGFE